jgi:hypothetical protein
MISAISGTSQASPIPQLSASDGSNKSKEAALQSQIDAKGAQAACTSCKDTAAKIEKEVATLKAQLTALQATDKNANSVSANGASSTAAARQAEFDGELSSNSGKSMWV